MPIFEGVPSERALRSVTLPVMLYVPSDRIHIMILTSSDVC